MNPLSLLHPISDLELVVYVLNGLSTNLKEISAAIRARDTPMSFEELYEKLLEHDSFPMQFESYHVEVPITAQVANRSPHSFLGFIRHFSTNNKLVSSSYGSSDIPMLRIDNLDLASPLTTRVDANYALKLGTQLVMSNVSKTMDVSSTKPASF